MTRRIDNAETEDLRVRSIEPPSEDERLARELAWSEQPWHERDQDEQVVYIEQGKMKVRGSTALDIEMVEEIGETIKRETAANREDLGARKTARPKADLGIGDDGFLPTINTAENWWIEEARTNPLAFGQYVFGHKPAKHHVRWASELFEQGSKRHVVIAPRGSAKTEWAMIFLLFEISRKPWTANAILSVSLKQAQDRLGRILQIVEHSERYRRVFPHIALDRRRSVTKMEFTLRDTRISYAAWRSKVSRKGDAKAATLYVSGIGGRGLIGGRINGTLLLDDVMDEKNAATEEQRDKLWDWLSTTVRNMLMPDAVIWHVTTRWTEDDIAQRQINTGQFTHSVTAALERGENGDVRSYWPEQYSLTYLGETAYEVGSIIFKLMYLNMPVSLNGELFQLDWLRKDIPDPLPKLKHIFVSVDPAFKVKTVNDRTAIATIGIDHDLRMYLIDLKYGRMTNNGIAVRFSDMWQAAYQEHNILPHALVETYAAQSTMLTLLANIGVVKNHAVVQFDPPVDKVTRALSFSAAAERGDFFMDQNLKWAQRLQSQCISFSGKDGETDDLVDVVSNVAYYLFGNLKVHKPAPGSTNSLPKIPGLI